MHHLNCIFFIMKCFVLLSFIHISFISGQTTIDDEISSRIVGGIEAIPHQFPYQVALFIKVGSMQEFCGGSIISDQYILTAAHCLDEASVAHVILGAHNIHKREPTQKYFKSKDFTIHEKWRLLTLTADIALIKLPTKIEFSDEIKPIRLPAYSDGDTNLSGTKITISGWGKISDEAKDINPTLRYAESHIISQFWCNLAFLFIPNKNHICMSGRKRKTICNGDSGGPLVTVGRDETPTLQGISSFGFGYGCRFRWPAVFTRVSSYLEWIHDKTGIYIRE